MSTAPAQQNLDGHEAIPRLSRMCADSAWSVRAEAAKAIGDASITALAPELIKLLDDESKPVRIYAAQALSKVGDESAVSSMRAAARKGWPPYRMLIRWRAVELERRLQSS